MALEIRNREAFLKPPRAVLFDADNTLYPYAPAHRAAMAAAEAKAEKLLGLEPARFRQAFDAARQTVKDQLGRSASAHSRLLYFQRTIEGLGMKSQLLATLDLEQTYWRSFLAAAKLFPGLTAFVQDLRSAGIATAVVTDLTAQIQFRKLIYFGLDGLFDYVVTSEEAGADKPAQAPFRLALAKLDAEPADCWMIGDDVEADIGGGREIGLVTLQIRHAGVASGRGAFKADAAFDRFETLSGWLKENGRPVGTADTG